MGNDHSSNIFDEAAKKSSSLNKKKSLIAKETPTKNPAAPPTQLGTPSPTPPTGKISDAQLAELFKKADRMKKDIDDKLQEIYTKTGLSPKQIEKYLSDPKNFTPAQWKSIQVGKEDWEGKLYKIIGQEYKVKRAKTLEDKNKKERKGKTLGGRKNWIPMR